MKTAVSIPDDVFEQAEALARELNISRSELYANALRSIVASQDLITRQLDAVHGAVVHDPAIAAAARRAIRAIEW